MQNYCTKNIYMLYFNRKGVSNMILSITVNNFLIFSNEVKLSLKANMKIKRMQSNIIQSENINILKTIALYGSNNVGKTCLIRAIASIKNVL